MMPVEPEGVAFYGYETYTITLFENVKPTTKRLNDAQMQFIGWILMALIDTIRSMFLSTT